MSAGLCLALSLRNSLGSPSVAVVVFTTPDALDAHRLVRQQAVASRFVHPIFACIMLNDSTPLEPTVHIEGHAIHLYVRSGSASVALPFPFLAVKAVGAALRILEFDVAIVSSSHRLFFDAQQLAHRMRGLPLDAAAMVRSPNALDAGGDEVVAMTRSMAALLHAHNQSAILPAAPSLWAAAVRVGTESGASVVLRTDPLMAIGGPCLDRTILAPLPHWEALPTTTVRHVRRCVARCDCSGLAYTDRPPIAMALAAAKQLARRPAALPGSMDGNTAVQLATRGCLSYIRRTTLNEVVMCNHTLKREFEASVGRTLATPSMRSFFARAELVMREVIQLMDAMDIPFMLAAGTLLNWVRQCSLGYKPDDFDIAVMLEDLPTAPLLSEFRARGFTAARVFGRSMSYGHELTVVKKGIQVDIFTNVERERDIMHTAWEGNFTCELPPEPLCSGGNVFALSFPKIKFAWAELFPGVRVRVPHPAPAWLHAQYGDGWKSVHKGKWHWIYSTKNYAKLMSAEEAAVAPVDFLCKRFEDG